MLVLAIFASVVAPFGGFFASGFKRAFKIKDFGDSIPGHGGKNYTRNEWRRYKTTLETSGEDIKLHSKRVEKI